MHYVMSDIHGNRRRFDAVMDQIGLRKEDTLYVLGDVIDRHPWGIELLLRFMGMPNVRMLLGNHEFMMLNALAERDEKMPWPKRPEELSHWYRNGGQPTREAFLSLPPGEQRRVKDYLKELPLREEISLAGHEYTLVHAAPAELFRRTHRREYSSETEFAVWYRLEDFPVLPASRTLIFGHTPTMYYQGGSPLSIWHGAGAVDIDCGSGFPDEPGLLRTRQGRLACLCLEDGKEYYSE